MQRAAEHPVPVGPLAVRWLGWELEPPRAGADTRALVALENAGSASWRSRGREGVQLAYHWLDEKGNALLWDGVRSPFAGPVAPGESVEVAVRVVAPVPAGRYRLAFDLVHEHRFWFAELGGATLDVDVDVAPRIAARRLAVVVHGGEDPATRAALAAQEEPLVEEAPEAVAHLVAGVAPPPDWSRRLLDAHAEGWAAVGPAVESGGWWLARRRAAWLAPWGGEGRNPRFPGPLLLPSLVAGLEPGEHRGLPAWDGPGGLFDGRIRLRLPPGRRRP